MTDPSNEQVSLHDLLSMEEVLLTGVDAMELAAQILFVRHCVDSKNWARNRKRKQIMGDNTQAESKACKVANKSESAAAAAKGTSAAEASSNQHPVGFTVLVPGVDGALSDMILRDKTFVISGTFPEVGGGDADSVGVANVKAMIQSFGGKVISRFSKKTSEFRVLKYIYMSA